METGFGKWDVLASNKSDLENRVHLPLLGHNDPVRTRKGKSRMRSVNLTTPQEFRNIFDRNYHYLNVKVACFTFHSLQLYCKTLTLRKKRNHCYLLGQIYIEELIPFQQIGNKVTVMRISTEWCKTKTKEITMTNQSKGNHHNKPIRIQIQNK